MQKPKIDSVLEKIIALTSERDSNTLELSLAQTLLTLAGVNNLNIHSAGNIKRIKKSIENGEKHLKDETISPEMVEPLSTCLDTGEVLSIVNKGKPVTLFPLKSLKQQPLAVILVEEAPNSDENVLIVSILKIYHNFLSLMNENERDPLTGLLNRKTFDLKINTIIAELQEKERNQNIETSDSSFLAIFDIDHFKKVNDTHGHLIGDEVLLLFSRLMEKNFRDLDFLFRFGGEEFVGVFQCPNSEKMTAVLNRFRALIEGNSFPQVGHVTVSCGFTRIEALDLSSNIIDRADVALYHAKNNGRNQVCCHEDLVALGLLAEDDTSGGEIELF